MPAPTKPNVVKVYTDRGLARAQAFASLDTARHYFKVAANDPETTEVSPSQMLDVWQFYGRPKDNARLRSN